MRDEAPCALVPGVGTLDDPALASEALTALSDERAGNVGSAARANCVLVSGCASQAMRRNALAALCENAVTATNRSP